jgi:hypothetical protein
MNALENIMNVVEQRQAERYAFLKRLAEQGFHFVSETRGECDERGIDGVMILKRKRNKNGKGSVRTFRERFYICAHYRVGNRYGEPLPLRLQ